MTELFSSLVVLVALAACTAADGSRVVRRTVGDTTFITSPADGTDGPASLRDLTRIDLAALGINRVDAGAFGPNGTLWLFDAVGDNGASIHVLDSLGHPVTIAGREGAGPGEYRAPLRIFQLSNSTMLVKEMQTTRAVLFDARGLPLATLTLPPAAIGWVVTPDNAGGWFIAASFEASTSARVGRFGWIHFSPDGVAADTVFPPSSLFAEPTPDGISPGRIRTVGRDGSVLTTIPGPNRLTWYGVPEHVRVLEWGGEPAAYGTDERQEMQLVINHMNDLLGRPRASLPQRKQPVNRILTDGAGYTWLHLSMPGVRIAKEDLPREPDPLIVKWREPDRWAAVDSAGVVRFVVSLPLNAALLDREGDRLLATVADTSGIESVVVWRVLRAKVGGTQ